MRAGSYEVLPFGWPCLFVALASTLPACSGCPVKEPANDAPPANTDALVADAGGKSEARLQPPFRMLWEYTAPRDKDSAVVPSIRDLHSFPHALIFTAGPRYMAVAPQTGKSLWPERRATTSSWDPRLSPNDDGSRMVISDNTKVLMVDVRTGRTVWRTTALTYARAALLGDIVVFERSKGVVVAVDTNAGRIRWQRPIGGPPGKESMLSILPVRDKHKRVLLGTSEGIALCLDADTGDEHWRRRFSRAGVTAVVTHGIRTFVVTHRAVTGIETATGKRLWQTQIPGHRSGPAVVQQVTMMLVTADGWLRAIDLRDGILRWKTRVSTEFTESSPVALTSWHVLVGHARGIIAMGLDGSGKWTWGGMRPRTNPNAVVVLPDGFVAVVHSEQLRRYVHGEGRRAPLEPVARMRLAKQLVARLDQLSDEEILLLDSLGDQAFSELLPVVTTRLRAHAVRKKAAHKDDHAWDAEFRARDLAEAVVTRLVAVARPPHTKQMLSLTIKYPNNTIEEWLVAKGDDQHTVPYSLGVLRRKDARHPAWEWALETVARSRTPQAVDFLVRALEAKASKPVETMYRYSAFVNLARTGGARGVAAVLKARDTSRTVRPGLTHKGRGGPDSDRDGLVDATERRIGTNPHQRDTDKDGVPDGEDKNPTVAPRELSEGDKVLRAAFEGRFWSYGGKGALYMVQMCDQYEPMELFGPDAVIVALKKLPEINLRVVRHWGYGRVRFGPPRGDFSGAFVHAGSPCILWNHDRTEARVHIGVMYGRLNGTGYDVHIKKFGDHWLVIGLEQRWIS